MVSTHLDFALQKLAQIELDSFAPLQRQRCSKLRMELRFLKMFFWSYGNLDYAGNKKVRLDSFMSAIDVTLQGMVDVVHCNFLDGFEPWESCAHQLLEKMEHVKPQMKEICLNLLDSSVLRFESSTGDEIYDFMLTIHQNLEDILGSKPHVVVTVKDQIEVLQQKLKLFTNLVKFIAERSVCHEELVEDCVSKLRNNKFGKFIEFHFPKVTQCFRFGPCNPELRYFMVQVQAWPIKVASLSFLCWVDKLEEETLTKLVTICLDALQQIKPRSPEAIRMFLGVLMEASKSLRSNTLLMGEMVAGCVDMLLEDLTASVVDPFNVALRDGLIILITFLVDPPVVCGRDRNDIWARADALVDETASLISSLSAHEEKEGIANERDFLEKIDILKAEIRVNYVQIQGLSWSDFPRTNGLGFVDFLLGNLKEKTSSIPFAKCLLLAMQEKLISIRPYLGNVMEQQNKLEEQKDLWIRILGVAYRVEHAVDSCFFDDNQIWYKMICLSVFLEEIEFLITEVKKIRDDSVCESMVLGVEVNPSHTIPKYDNTSRLEEAVVGFQNEAKTIIDQLRGGSADLQIVSIVGMAGQGKTTLANKVYNDPAIKYHFHKLAWCFVSQAYQWKQLLLDILSDVTTLVHDKMHEMSEEELAEILYRCLKGQRYLIVLDDIWDIKAWYQLKESFPNDKNGSRIMFTSRSHRMASQTELGSSTHVLCPLSTVESWELLRKKLFNKDACPENLLELGLQIVEICGGLPLSIVVIAGVLARRVKDQTWWQEIATNLRSKILGEGCMSILELSYMHLPEHLKPCFLYFGAFQQGKAVKVQKLIQLWVAEGFIPKIGTKRLEDVAMDFLMDLIVRSVVIVVERSSNSGIKECRVHDLFFDLCLAKIEQDRFLRPLNDSQCPSNIKYEQYRLTIHTKWKSFIASNPTALFVRSLLIPQLGQWYHHPNDPLSFTKFFMKFKLLRVLDLDHGVYLDAFPEEITSLIHLRYLAIWAKSVLPPNVESLLNLEVLRVYSSAGETLVPPGIWKMKRLRHICLRGALVYFCLGNYVLENAQLDNVDTLSWPLLCHNEYSEELLRRFPKVRKLKFNLSVRRLQFLVLDFLSNLESLNVFCPMRMDHPCDFKFPSTLKKLTLSDSRLPWSEISAIAKLPNLEVLKLLDAFVGPRWDTEDEDFLKLRFLKLTCSDIQQWNACADPFPCLERLVIERCYELEAIPSSFGESSTLKLIEFRYCRYEAESLAREILKEQRDMGNDGFVVLITSGDNAEWSSTDDEWSSYESWTIHLYFPHLDMKAVNFTFSFTYIFPIFCRCNVGDSIFR